mmetsp:Transcript_33273/g.83821  ORF Transcript_33273/g.83821 Transcript_33273/m.83821 type:complete len:809 (+) Transcript_33273:563-2989(+)
MGCCGGGAEVSPAEGGEFVTPFTNRKCRDVFWLLCFLLFWGGMLFVGGYAIMFGNANKLLYGIDAMGNICGSVNEFNGTTLDLTSAKKLYFLDPFEMMKLDITQIPFAKSVCLPACPSTPDLCEWDAHFRGEAVCEAPTQFRCPYYASQTANVPELGHYDLWLDLPDIVGNESHPAAVNALYYAELATTNATTCDLGKDGGFGMLDDAWAAIQAAQFSSAAERCGQVYQHTSKVPNQGPCFPVFAKTVDYLNRCVPDASALTGVLGGLADKVGTESSTVGSALSEPSAVLQRYFIDLQRGIGIVIICGLVLACVLALAWMLVLRYFAGVMAWVAVILVNLIFAAGCFLCFQKSGLLGQAGAVGEFVTDAWEQANLPDELNPVTKDKQVWEVVAWISLVLFLLLLLFTILMIRRIKIAVACLKVASQAIASMPMIMFFPLLPFMSLVVLIAYWVVVAAMLYSVGDITRVHRTEAVTYTIPGVSGLDTPTDSPGAVPVAEMSDWECYHSPYCGFQVQWDDTLWYMGLYHLFGLLWTVQFILGYGYVSLAGAVGHFYWYRGDSALMPKAPILRGMWNAARYHLGSIALGSLILAVIQFVRILLEYIDRKTKRLSDTNPLMKWCMCCVKCCMWCLEKVVKFINRNAYIMMAIKGTSYCTSAGRAVGLILSNALRLIAVTIVGDSLIFLGKLCVVGACGVVAFFLAGSELYSSPIKNPDTYLTSPVAPIVLTVIVAYMCASVFFQVYEMSVDTILLCFCEDCDVNGEEPKFAPPLLMEAIGQKAHPNPGATGKSDNKTAAEGRAGSSAVPLVG